MSIDSDGRPLGCEQPEAGVRGRSGGWNDDSRNSGTMLYPICQSQIPQSDINGRHMWGNGMSSSFNVRVCVEADDYLFFQDDRMWIRESPVGNDIADLWKNATQIPGDRGLH